MRSCMRRTGCRSARYCPLSAPPSSPRCGRAWEWPTRFCPSTYGVLHEAGYLDVHKSTCASRVRTSVSLTRAGRTAYDGHLAALRAIVSNEAFDASAHHAELVGVPPPMNGRPSLISDHVLATGAASSEAAG